MDNSDSTYSMLVATQMVLSYLLLRAVHFTYRFGWQLFFMVHINDKADRQQATKDDPRIFPFGRFMP